MTEKYSSFDVARLALTNSYTDQVNSARTVEIGAGAAFVSDKFVFDTGSLQLSGTESSYIAFPTSADWQLASGDFSIDFWINSQSDYQSDLLSLISTNGESLLSIKQAGKYRISAMVTVADGSVLHLESASQLPVTERWNHLALVRQGNRLVLFFNGSSVDSIDISGSVKWVAGSYLRLGSLPGRSGGLNGFISHVRITKSTSRWRSWGFALPIYGFDDVSPNSTAARIGNNTWKIDLQGEHDLNAVVHHISTAAESSGWEVWDIYTEWSRTQIVLRALNQDGVTYKYANIVFDRVIWQLALTTCEYWDPVAKTMVNEAFTGKRSTVAGIASSLCEIVLFINPRYIALQSFLQGSPSLTAVVTEVEREATEDTAASATPCWGHFSTAMWSTTYGYTGEAAWTHMFSMPRLRDGRVGEEASRWGTIVTNMAAYGYMGRWGKICDWFHNEHGDKRGNLTNSFNPNSQILQTPKFTSRGETGVFSTYGRMFGVKIAPYVGAPMDRVSVPVDQDYFFDKDGASSEHWAIDLPINHGDYISNSTSPPEQSVWSVPNADSANCMIYTGRSIYLGSNNGVSKLDLVTGLAKVVPGPAGVVEQMVFDGRYVYAGTTSGLSRIDTKTNDQHQLLPLAAGAVVGCYGVCWDGWDRIYCTSRDVTTTHTVFAVSRDSFSLIHSAKMPTRNASNTVVECLSTDGSGKIVFPYLSATAADFSMGVLDQYTKGTHWRGLGSVADNGSRSITWTGWDFVITAGHSGTWEIPNDSGTSIVNIIAAGGAAVGSVNPVYWRTPILSIAIMGSTAPATAAPIVQSSIGGYIRGSTTASGRGVGSSPNSTNASRCGVFTGNSMYASGNNGTVVGITKIYKNSYVTPTRRYAQILLPR